MSSVVIAGDTSGSVTIAAPAIAGTTVITLPATTGTLISSGGALGTPSSGTLTSCTGLPMTTGVTGTLPIANGGTNSTATAYCSLTTNISGTLPVANGGTGVTTSTGSGAVVLGTSPTLTTPVINGFTGDTSVINIGSGQVYKDASGNVGIGTSSPTNKLTVNGGIDFSGTAFSGSGTGIWQQATNVLGFVTAGSTRAVIDASGNVGIGTTSPASKLNISGTNTGNGCHFRLQNTTASTGKTWQIASADDGKLYTSIPSVVDAVVIDSSGNVGIGTTSPSNKLDVFRSSFGGSNTSLILSSVNSASAKINFSGIGYSVDQGFAGIEAGSMYFSTYGSGALTERMRIDPSGNVGIGTSSPGSFGKLAVAGAIAPIGAVGTSSIDVTGAATTVASGGTVNFPNASGMLVVNQHNTGGVTIYLCGGGGAGVVANIISQVGTFTYNSGIAGYTWTSSSTSDYGFFFVRTRPTA